MSEYRTLLLDPLSSSSSRAVFRVDQGVKIMSKKVRLLNFGLSNNSGNGVYFNHNGVYSLISRISINNLQGQEIDYLRNVDYMGIKLLHMPNSAQFSMARQMAQNMCTSVFVDSLSQLSLTEESQRDDASLMGNSLYIDVSFMLQYLMSRNVIDEGFTLIIEWTSAEVLGYSWSFTRPPVLAVDECLTPVEPDPVESVYLTVIPDKLIISEGQYSLEQRLNSFYNQRIHNFFYYNTLHKSDNLLGLPVAKKLEKLEVTIDGRKLIPLKGVDNDAKKLALLHDFENEVSLCHYSAYTKLEQLDDVDFALYNPNLGIYYQANFSYGCVRFDKYIGQDLTVSYSFDPEDAPAVGKTDTLNILCEVLRSYNRMTGNVRFVTM